MAYYYSPDGSVILFIISLIIKRYNEQLEKAYNKKQNHLEY